jgi:hypothetical protein
MAATLTLFAVPLFLAFERPLDVVLFCFFALLRNWAFVKLYIDPSVVIGLLKGGAALFAIAQLLRYVICLNEPSSNSDEFPNKPMIFPCRTSHTRLAPKTHSFSYSYLWVGVPVGWKGSVGGLLSSDDSRHVSPWYLRLLSLKSSGAWHTVNGDDYLGRGHVDGGLKRKLHNYLQSQVWLVDPGFKQY